MVKHLDKDNGHVIAGLRAISVAGLQLRPGVQGVKVALGQYAGHHLHQQHCLLEICIDAVGSQTDDLQTKSMSAIYKHGHNHLQARLY